MAQEIERKFLVTSQLYRATATSVSTIRQGYLSTDRSALTVRVRITDVEARITIKGPSSNGGLSRSEWEYTIPSSDAEEILSLCSQTLIEKRRYRVPYEGHIWEVDSFEGALEGLEIAEVELASEEETIALPQWIGDEVTGDPSYYNAVLAQKRALTLPPTKKS